MPSPIVKDEPKTGENREEIKQEIKVHLPKPLYKAMSKMTLKENQNNLRSMVNLQSYDPQTELLNKKVNQNTGGLDIGRSLKLQKEDIKLMMLETNKVFPGYKSDPYDFHINDMKLQGRVELKAQPYVQYIGKVRLKGNESPMRFELL